MKEHDRLAGSSRSGSVVVEPRAVYIDELTPHEVTCVIVLAPGGTRAWLRRSCSRGKMFQDTRHNKQKSAALEARQRPLASGL